MLQTCANVEEAIKYYSEVNEPGFGWAKTMLIDKTGASAIIGWNSEKNELEVIRKKGNYQIMGYGVFEEDTLKEISVDPTVDKFYKMLCKINNHAAYQNIYDLQKGEVYFTCFEYLSLKKINLEEELAKGAHVCNLPDFFVIKHNNSAYIAAILGGLAIFILMPIILKFKKEKSKMG